jgi:hypothetical protein
VRLFLAGKTIKREKDKIVFQGGPHPLQHFLGKRTGTMPNLVRERRRL